MVVTDLSISFLLVYVDYGCILEFLWYSLLHPHATLKCLRHYSARQVLHLNFGPCSITDAELVSLVSLFQSQFGIHQAQHFTPPVALSLIVDERLSTLSKYSTHLKR